MSVNCVSCRRLLPFKHDLRCSHCKNLICSDCVEKGETDMCLFCAFFAKRKIAYSHVEWIECKPLGDPICTIILAERGLSGKLIKWTERNTFEKIKNVHSQVHLKNFNFNRNEIWHRFDYLLIKEKEGYLAIQGKKAEDSGFFDIPSGDRALRLRYMGSSYFSCDDFSLFLDDYKRFIAKVDALRCNFQGKGFLDFTMKCKYSESLPQLSVKGPVSSELLDNYKQTEDDQIYFFMKPRDSSAKEEVEILNKEESFLYVLDISEGSAILPSFQYFKGSYVIKNELDETMKMCDHDVDMRSGTSQKLIISDVNIPELADMKQSKIDKQSSEEPVAKHFLSDILQKYKNEKIKTFTFF